MEELIERLRNVLLQNGLIKHINAAAWSYVNDLKTQVEELEGLAHRLKGVSMEQAKSGEKLQQKLDVAESVIEELEASPKYHHPDCNCDDVAGPPEPPE